jgi:Monooxygenase af470-like
MSVHRDSQVRVKTMHLLRLVRDRKRRRPLTDRCTACADGDPLIGARPGKLHIFQSVRDLGGRRGMKFMLDHLVAHLEKGLLGYEMGLKTIVQYWRSFAHLEAFAKDADDPHLEVWRSYWKRVGEKRGPGSGTRHSWCAPASTRRSTGTCRLTGWPRHPAPSRWPRPSAPAGG